MTMRPGGCRRLADMSLPPEQRRRKQKKRGTGKGASKQMNHGSSAEGRKQRREGERAMRRQKP